jgi:hypothetical protein
MKSLQVFQFASNSKFHEAHFQMANDNRCNRILLRRYLDLLGMASHRNLSVKLFASAKRRFADASNQIVRGTRQNFYRSRNKSFLGRQSAIV